MVAHLAWEGWGAALLPLEPSGSSLRQLRPDMMSSISRIAAMAMATSLARMRWAGVPLSPTASATRSDKVGGAAGITGR